MALPLSKIPPSSVKLSLASKNGRRSFGMDSFILGHFSLPLNDFLKIGIECSFIYEFLDRDTRDRANDHIWIIIFQCRFIQIRREIIWGIVMNSGQEICDDVFSSRNTWGWKIIFPELLSPSLDALGGPRTRFGKQGCQGTLVRFYVKMMNCRETYGLLIPNGLLIHWGFPVWVRISQVSPLILLRYTTIRSNWCFVLREKCLVSGKT